MITITRNLGFAWWNTSLKPVNGVNRSDEHFDIAKSIITKLIEDANIDFFGLTEINKQLSDKLSNSFTKNNYRIFCPDTAVGRTRFDIAAIYNEQNMILLNHQVLSYNHGNRTIKIAIRYKFLIKSTLDCLYFYLCHWPSRLIESTNRNFRAIAGGQLRDNILNIFKQNEEKPHVIIMGDFNDEPFNESLSKKLLASRDRNLVMKNDKFFYNPFWRKLGENKSYPSNNKDKICGTYYYKNGFETKWHTFDQFIFSSNFFSKDGWNLDEDKLNIVQTPPIIELIKSNDFHFDHLPIIATIQHKELLDE